MFNSEQTYNISEYRVSAHFLSDDLGTFNIFFIPNYQIFCMGGGVWGPERFGKLGTLNPNMRGHATDILVLSIMYIRWELLDYQWCVCETLCKPKRLSCGCSRFYPSGGEAELLSLFIFHSTNSKRCACVSERF